MRGVRRWVGVSFAAAALAAGRAEAVTYSDARAGVSVDFALPDAQVCVLLPASLRDGAGCEGLDVDALSARVAGVSAAVVVRERGSTRTVVLDVSPRSRHSVARVEEAREFTGNLIDGVLRDGTRRLVGDPAAARLPTSLTVERGAQVARSRATITGDDGTASLAQAMFFGRDVVATLACTTPVADAEGGGALLERIAAQTAVTPPEGKLAWSPRPPPPSGPIVFRDAARGVSFDAQFPGARVCVVQPASLRTEAGCEDTPAAAAPALRDPELLFVARVTDERVARVFTVKATPRAENARFYIEDADEFDRSLRRELAAAGRPFEDDGIPATRAVERGVQVVRNVIVLGGAADGGAARAEGRAMVVAYFLGRNWTISMSLVTTASDVTRSTEDLDRIVHGAEVTAPTGPHGWESRDTPTGDRVTAALGLGALCAAAVLGVRAFVKRRRG